MLGEYVNTVKNAYHRFCEFWTLDRVGVAFVILGILSLMPILYCSFYDYANGDDLAYSWTIHRLMINGASFGAIVAALCDVVVKTYHVWQGTWSSIVLFELQPGLLGEKAYIIVPWIALLCIIGGTGYILHDLLVNRLKLQKNRGVLVHSDDSADAVNPIYSQNPRRNLLVYKCRALYHSVCCCAVVYHMGNEMDRHWL